MSLKYFTLALAATAAAAPGSPFQALEAQASSDNPCEPCQPSGATGMDPPAVSSDLSSLYVNVLDSVKGISFSKRDGMIARAATSGFCCVASLNCVNVQSLNIPMCYDKFTTNFKFPDGSYGSLTTGEYNSNNQQINLLTGDYSGGNIYSAVSQDKPNTLTLSIPAQYTGTGVGAAIPASELGSVIVYTTTIPGTTFTAPTVIPGTVRAATVNGVAVSTSIAPQTITQATTIAPQTTVVTTQVPDASGSASSEGAAGAVSHDSSKSLGVSILGALMYFLM
ncbi:uncharacterized protein M421DRAFT_312941 [Didymella exigua CBS 183.55]|uniref:Uncharacterized protein n=1 Tax=Didymella exigua CBS 183.55 TaxID=1150837 RepID=A0A6A5RYY1_9PLEO|nr:uncharacterized protein M421DRAFT_312941 [Didymella exigua CBS 183.55]KAF1931486.1 hypothetical protein M421DRAFT_312941 [Didymella exigua CBS 183.55]